MDNKTNIKQEDITRVKAMGFLWNKGTECFNGRVITRNGKITAEECKCISEAAEKFGNGNIAMTTRLTMEVQGIPYEKIDDFRAFVAQAGLETGGTGDKVRPVVSCKGTTCHFGLIDTYAISEEIHKRFFKGYGNVKLPHKFKIAVGGCPNNCVKPDLNDIGIVGQRIRHFNTEKCRGCKKCMIAQACPMGAIKVENGVAVTDKSICNNCGRCLTKCPFHANDEYETAYRIYIGGRWGKKTAMGRSLSVLLKSEEEVYNVVESALLFFKENGNKKERFADLVTRMGFENVEKQLLSGELLKRKEEIIARE